MSELNPHEQPVTPMPQTAEELHTFIAKSFAQLMAIPENATIMAQTVLNANVRAFSDSRDLLAREGLKPVVVRTEYDGALRATVMQATTEGDEPLQVEFHARGKEGEWLSATGFKGEALAALSRLVLSQTAVPGDVFYVTTNAAVEQQRESVAQAMQAQADAVSAQVEEPVKH